MFVYLSEVPGTVDLNKGAVVALPEGTRFRCRGEIGPDDDPQAFKRQLAKSGFLVAFSTEQVGQMEGTENKKVYVATADQLGIGHITGG